MVIIITNYTYCLIKIIELTGKKAKLSKFKNNKINLCNFNLCSHSGALYFSLTLSFSLNFEFINRVFDLNKRKTRLL